jgi:hypothetical protein
VPFKQIEKNKQKKTHIFGGPSCFRPGNPIQVEICRKRHQVGPNKMKQFLRIFLLAKRKKKKKVSLKLNCQKQFHPDVLSVQLPPTQTALRVGHDIERISYTSCYSYSSTDGSSIK